MICKNNSLSHEPVHGQLQEPETHSPSTQNKWFKALQDMTWMVKLTLFELKRFIVAHGLQYHFSLIQLQLEIWQFNFLLIEPRKSENSAKSQFGCWAKILREKINILETRDKHALEYEIFSNLVLQNSYDFSISLNFSNLVNSSNSYIS